MKQAAPFVLGGVEYAPVVAVRVLTSWLDGCDVPVVVVMDPSGACPVLAWVVQLPGARWHSNERLFLN